MSFCPKVGSFLSDPTVPIPQFLHTFQRSTTSTNYWMNDGHFSSGCIVLEAPSPRATRPLCPRYIPADRVTTKALFGNGNGKVVKQTLALRAKAKRAHDPPYPALLLFLFQSQEPHPHRLVQCPRYLVSVYMLVKASLVLDFEFATVQDSFFNT